MLAAVKSFLTGLLEKKLLDALLVPLELPGGGNVVPTLVSHPDKLRAASPLAPVMPLNSARMVSEITALSSSPGRLGVVLRPCELRALIELVKLKQASLENLLLIGTDCPGTYPVGDYARLVREGKLSLAGFLNRFIGGEEDPLLRKACQACDYPVPTNTDLTLGLLGAGQNSVLLESHTEQGDKIIEALGLAETKAEGREAATNQLLARRAEKREQLLKQVQEQVHGLENLMASLSTCINCHNCKTACPICYCKECFFDSSVFEFEAEKYLTWARRRGAIRMPTDTLFFHLTRLNHMVASCVGCGLCSEACPSNVPVFEIFRLVAERVQKLFDYVPGRSLEEELPVATFREAELTDFGT